jgi:hypothetical protein
MDKLLKFINFNENLKLIKLIEFYFEINLFID